MQTVTYNFEEQRFYFTLGEEILSEKFQWKFSKEPIDEQKSQPIESERSFMQELSLPAI